ncbi:hypothetical protein BDF14DRAFT_1736384 [Spinellus fusiger]|nr:hypothetical protein BDF14DRAFT_1736384 [Spinellus fusiger]
MARSSASTSTAVTSSGASGASGAASNGFKPQHSVWGVIKDQDFHPLTLKHQRDLENLFLSGTIIQDFYFWQANLGGYCMANMIHKEVAWAGGSYDLERRMVEGAPHPGRRKKKRGLS